DTSGINTAAPYATLDFYEDSAYYESPYVSVYGYAGDGTATAADLTASAVRLGQFDPTAGTAWRRVVLDRSALNGLLSQSSVVGLRFVTADYTIVDIHGIGSAEPPRLTFWSSE